MTRKLKRLAARLRVYLSKHDDLKDRVFVERKLFEVYEGKRGLPSKEECRDWAIRLGVPKAYRDKR